MLNPLVMLRHWARILVTWRHRSYVSNGSIFCRTFARWTRHSPPRPHHRRLSWRDQTTFWRRPPRGIAWPRELPPWIHPVDYTGQARQGSDRTRVGPVRSVFEVGDSQAPTDGPWEPTCKTPSYLNSLLCQVRKPTPLRSSSYDVRFVPKENTIVVLGLFRSCT